MVNQQHQSRDCRDSPHRRNPSEQCAPKEENATDEDQCGNDSEPSRQCVNFVPRIHCVSKHRSIESSRDDEIDDDFGDVLFEHRGGYGEEVGAGSFLGETIGNLRRVTRAAPPNPKNPVNDSAAFFKEFIATTPSPESPAATFTNRNAPNNTVINPAGMYTRLGLTTISRFKYAQKRFMLNTEFIIS